MDYIATYEKFLKLTKRGKKYFALCPFHEETNPSFSIDPETGFFYCFGCAAKGTVHDFLKRMQSHQELQEPKAEVLAKNKFTAEDYEIHKQYFYFDPNGEVLYVKHRFEKPKKEGIPQKTFTIEWKTRQKNIHFYNLPVLSLLKENTEIWFAEGEKCAEAVQNAIEVDAENGIYWNAVVLGFVFGDKEVQSLVNLYPAEAHQKFKQRNVKIFVDNDETGIKKAELLANALKTLKVKKVEFIRFKSQVRGYDIADFLSENTLSDAISLTETFFEKKMFSGSIYDLVSMPDEDETYIGGDFLKINKGVITLIAGSGGIGKSMISIYMACELLAEGKNVFILSLEDSIRRIRKRFKNILNRFTKTIPESSIITIVEYSDEDIFELIEDALTEHDVVFIDPIAALLANENDNSEISKLMRKFTAIIQKYDKNLILIHHTKKYLTGNKDKENLTKEDLYEAVRGASSITNSVKHVVLVRRNKKDPEVLEYITLKNNYGSLNNDFLIKNLLNNNTDPVEFVPYSFYENADDSSQQKNTRKKTEKKQKYSEIGE